MLATHTNPCMADGRKRQQRKEKGSLTEAMALAVSSGEKKICWVIYLKNHLLPHPTNSYISGLVVKFSLAMRVPRVRFPADIISFCFWNYNGHVTVKS